MKIVLLADLHGNMVATEAMERELDRIGPDEVWFLGDAVGKGPAPLRITILSVPYDNRQAAERANLYPDLPRKEAYQREVLTGIYSR